jgi:mannose-6-phosphate isomerase-like protein (cupin superfamily)
MTVKLTNSENRKPLTKAEMVEIIQSELSLDGYDIVEINSDKPWGAYFRIDSNQADQFVNQYFPGLSPSEARLGIENAELSPKILLVSPVQRLSWQYHNRRAERWKFLSSGGYYRSLNDEQGELVIVESGNVVQFQKSERHRLCAAADDYTIVAEIWQHIDPQNLSNEDDIHRLKDDYERTTI